MSERTGECELGECVVDDGGGEGLGWVRDRVRDRDRDRDKSHESGIYAWRPQQWDGLLL